MTNEEYKKWQKGATRKEHTSAKGRGYDQDWRRIRLAALARACNLCEVNDSEDCSKDTPRPATEVDHKVPITVRPDLRLDMRNLQASCRPCNRRKVHTDATPQGRARIKALSEAMPPITGPFTF